MTHVELRSELLERSKTIIELIELLGSIKELIKFFEWTYSDPEMISCMLMQGDDDRATEFEGQDIVYDGSFCLGSHENSICLIYVGWAGYSGMGGKVQRVVKLTDEVMAG